MGKLAKRYNSVKAAVKHAASSEKESLSAAGHKALEVSAAIGLMVADKNMGGGQVLPVNPSAAATAGGLAMMMFGKGKTRRLGQTIATAGALAVGARYVYTGQIGVVSGADGKASIGSPSVAGPTPTAEPKVVVNISADMLRDAIRDAQRADREAQDVIDQSA